MIHIDYGKNQELELEFVATIVKKVAATYMSKLRNNKYFKSLVSDLKVEIKKTKKGTTGVCITKKNAKICLKVNPADSDKYIALVVAHEFAHLMMTTKYLDSLAISGEARDGSFNATAIQRILPSGELYGNALEECIANYLAYYIVSSMNFPREEDYEEHLARNEYFIYVISMLEYVFGPALIECQYIDDEIDEGENISFNMFWRSILSFSFANVVNVFNETMGDEKAFRRFCDVLEIYKASQEKAKEYREELDQTLEKFLSIATEEVA